MQLILSVIKNLNKTKTVLPIILKYRIKHEFLNNLKKVSSILAFSVHLKNTNDQNIIM